MEKLKKFVLKKADAATWKNDIFIIKNYAYATEDHILVRKKLDVAAMDPEMPEDVKENIVKMFDKIEYTNKLEAKTTLQKLRHHKPATISDYFRIG